MPAASDLVTCGRLAEVNHTLDHAWYLQAKNLVNPEFSGALVSEWQRKATL